MGKPRHTCTMLMWHVCACTYLRYMPAIRECMHHTQCCTDAHCFVNCKLWMTYSAYYGIMQCRSSTRHAHVACACMYLIAIYPCKAHIIEWCAMLHRCSLFGHFVNYAIVNDAYHGIYQTTPSMHHAHVACACVYLLAIYACNTWMHALHAMLHRCSLFDEL